MKKSLVGILLCLLMVFTAMTALAVDVYPGDTITMNISLTSAEGSAARVSLNTNGAPVSFVKAVANNHDGNAVAEMQSLTGRFSIMNLNGVVTGPVGTVTLRINDNAAPGNYTVSPVGTLGATGVSGSISFTVLAPSCEHTYDAGVVTTPATCEAAGVKTLTCTKCGDTKPVEIPALGHDYDDGVQTVNPTCNTAGVMTFTCATCGGTYTEPIAATGKHTWNEGTVTKPATCLEDGEKTFTCTGCGLTDTAVITAPGKHTYDASNATIDKQPTCTEAGHGSFTCTACGAVIDGGEIPAMGHDYQEAVTKQVTCGADGEKTTTCSRCDYKVVEVIPATGAHTNETKVTTAATCGTAGVETTTCTVCGKTETKEIPATGKHTYAESIVKQETCGAEGEKKFTCSVCGDNYSEKIPATGKHTYEEKITTEATCTVKGEKTFTCSVCGDKYTEEIAAKGHTPGADLNEKKPTCTKPGYKYYTCTACGTEVKEADIPATGVHIYEVTEEVPATCTKDGKRVSKCTYEGCTKTKTEKLKKLGHKMGDWFVAKAPTCTENGQEKRECLNGCGKADTRTLKAGHSYGDWSVDQEAGTKTHTCGVCGNVETKNLSTHYTMTVCTHGIRFRDLDNPITKDWYMFTPVDLSVEGEQTIDLIAGNMHQIGTATILVKDGKVTVTTAVNNARNIAYEEEFLTFVPALADLTGLDFEAMTNYNFGEEISIEEALGGDTKVLLLIRNRAWYEDTADGVNFFSGKGSEYRDYVESLKELMD